MYLSKSIKLEGKIGKYKYRITYDLATELYSIDVAAGQTVMPRLSAKRYTDEGVKDHLNLIKEYDKLGR